MGTRLLAGILCCAFVLAAGPAGAEEGGVAIGSDAPAFEARDLDGAPVTLRELLSGSRVVLVNFWGIRCGSCLEEMPHLAALAGRLGPKGLQVVGVNVDGMDGKRLKELLPKAGITPAYPLVTDPEMKIMDAFGVTVAPFTAAIGKNGKVAFTHVGYSEGEEAKIAKAVEDLLSPPDPPK